MASLTAVLKFMTQQFSQKNIYFFKTLLYVSICFLREGGYFLIKHKHSCVGVDENPPCEKKIRESCVASNL